MTTSLRSTVWFFLLIAAAAPADDELLLHIEQSFSGPAAQYTRVDPGDEVTIVLSIHNVGELPGTGIALRYEWPAGLELIDVAAIPASAVTVGAGGTLDWHVGNLFPSAGSGSSATLTLTGRVRHAVAGKTLHGDLSLIASDQPATWKSSLPPAFGVSGSAVVDLSIAASGRFSQSGSVHNLTYDVSIENAGPETAAEVFLLLEIGAVTADLIENPTLTGSAGTTCDVDLPGCVYMNLGPGESITFTATGQVSVDDGPVNIGIDFVAATNDSDSDTSNNRARASVSLPEAPDDGGGGSMGLLLIALLAAFMAARAAQISRQYRGHSAF